jgi:hypothetical protein
MVARARSATEWELKTTCPGRVVGSNKDRSQNSVVRKLGIGPGAQGSSRRVIFPTTLFYVPCVLGRSLLVPSSSLLTTNFCG